MKMTYDLTISGADKKFDENDYFVETFFGEEWEAKRRRQEIEKETGQIIYLSLTIPQP